MLLRIFGWCLLVAGVALAFFSLRTLNDAGDMGRFMAEAGDALRQPIDAQHWSWRWRVNAIGFGILAVGCLISAMNFIRGRRHGWIVLSATVAANLAWLLAGRGQGAREDAFEATSTQLMGTAILAAFCAWAAWRFNRPATR
jgi:hypothetical protein